MTDITDSIEPNIGTLRWRILDLLRKCGATGATDDELQSWTGINPSAQRPRRIELCEAGLVRNSGRTRRTRSGRQAVVWVALRIEVTETNKGATQ